MANAKVLKERFHEAREEAKANENGRYTVPMLRALKDMADNDVYPDGTFGDIDCNVWSMFREGRHVL